MIDLKQIDLICIDCIDPLGALQVLDYCCLQISFGNVKLFTDVLLDVETQVEIIKIERITNKESYSDFCLKLNKYCFNDYVLIVQRDGFILNPELWKNDFLEYDYIGAPFIQFGDGQNFVGNGGFSLRSRRFLEFSSKFDSCNGAPEDGFLTYDRYDEAINFGIKFPDIHFAFQFSVENYRPELGSRRFNSHNCFGFHGNHLLKFVAMQKPHLKDLIYRVNHFK